MAAAPVSNGGNHFFAHRLNMRHNLYPTHAFGLMWTRDTFDFIHKNEPQYAYLVSSHALRNMYYIADASIRSCVQFFIFGK